MNLIKAFRQFMADIKQAINDPYICASEEGKQMWCEIEEWEKQQGDTTNSKNENQRSE